MLPLAQKLTSLLAAAALAGLAAYFGGADKWIIAILSLTTGIVVDSIFNFVRMENSLKRFEKTISDATANLENASATALGRMEQTISAFGLTLAAQERGRHAELEALAAASHDIPNEKMPSVWKKLNWAVAESYCATNFIDPADIYGPQQAKDVFRIQAAKARADKIPIRKVLIVADPRELENPINRELVTNHLEGGIQLHWITRGQIDTCAELRKFPKELMDFAVIDRRIVLIWKLSADRKVQGGEIRVGMEACKPFLAFFDALHNEATPQFLAPTAGKSP